MHCQLKVKWIIGQKIEDGNNMVSIKPFNKEHEQIFRRLMRSNIAYTDDIKLSRSFGRHYSSIIDGGFLDIARIDKKKRTIFVTPPEIRIVRQHKRFFFHRID